MAVPGLSFSIYMFDGARQGLKICYGYSACIFDSSGENGPEDPAVTSPSFGIDENAAGTLEFTLLSGSTCTFKSNGNGPSATPIDVPNQLISDYICYKQTEIAIVRRTRINGGLEAKEIWNGRVGGIRKDFRNNWVILVEGAFSYFSDFVTIGRKWEPPTSKNARQLLTAVLNYYSADETSAVTGALATVHGKKSDGTTYEFRQLRRQFTIGSVSGKLEYTPSNVTLEAEESFEVTNGTKYMEVIQNLITRFGGHIEIVPTIDSETGYSVNTINWWGDDEYGTSGTKQSIIFGLNLLEYSEDLEDSEFFTVLHPIALASQTKETTEEEETTETETKTEYIDITSVNTQHPGTPYIYDNTIVDKYGFIVRMEQWNLDEPKSLFAVASRYYTDQKIGAPIINVSAFDLKNLLNTDLSSNQYLSIDSLYLYDRVTVQTAFGNVNLPVVGIQIPLDKFPTDTKYTITNSKIRKTALSPQNVVKRTKKEDPLPSAPDGTGADVTPTETEPYVEIIGSKLGIDRSLPHYPPIYLARDKAALVVTNISGNNYTLEVDSHTQAIQLSRAPGTIFYADNIKNDETFLRERKSLSDETLGNRYEKAYDPTASNTYPIMSYASAWGAYFTNQEANAYPSQPWAKAYTGAHINDIYHRMNHEFINRNGESITFGYFKSQILEKLNGLYLFDNNTLGTVLSGLGMTLSFDTDALRLGVTIHGSSDYTCYQYLQGEPNNTPMAKRCYEASWRPSSDADARRFLARVSVLNTPEASIIFYSAINTRVYREDIDNLVPIAVSRAAGLTSITSDVEPKVATEGTLRWQLFAGLISSGEVQVGIHNNSPILIITKTTDMRSGSTGYGVICNTSNRISQENYFDITRIGENLYKMGGGPIGNGGYWPYLFCEETINVNSSEDYDQMLTVSDATPPAISIAHQHYPYRVSQEGFERLGPLAILTKLGAPFMHTICNGVYLQIGGEINNQHLFSGTSLDLYDYDVISDTNKPGLRSETQVTSMVNYSRINDHGQGTTEQVRSTKYYGSDMHQTTEHKATDISSIVSEPKLMMQDYVNITPVVIGDCAYYRIGNFIFVKITDDRTEESNNG